MKTLFQKYGYTLTSAIMGLVVAISIVRCGSSSGGGGVAYKQIEQLARPGINELFVLTYDSYRNYNIGAPAFTGFTTEQVNGVVGEAKTVFKALFHLVCLADGLLGFTAATGLKPAGIQCGKVGDAGATSTANFFTDGNALTGTLIHADQQAAASTYADRIASNFLLDVMRLDFSGTSGYGAQVCGSTGTDNVPLLCGGRMIQDDVIDISYNYLLTGLFVPFSTDTSSATFTTFTGALNAGQQAQVRALVSDGVHYINAAAPVAADNPTSVTVAAGATTATSQGHEAASTTFPYAPKPY